MTTQTTAVEPRDPFDDPVTSNKMAVRALIPLLITFVLGTLCLQGFNLVFQQVGADVGAPNQASLITAFPSIVLGIVCFIYGSLGDFVSLRKLVTVGLVTLFIGSLFGFVIFGFATAFLTLFFSYMAWWMLLVSVVLYVAFGFYINKAANPFITPAFFKNTRWLRAISLILVFYFVNYALSPIFNAIGTNIYHMTTTQVSLHIVWAFVVAAVVGTCSGMIIGKIGIKAGLVTAGTLMFVGWTGAAFCVNSGFVVLTMWACVFYAGCGMMYSPVVSTVLGTIEKDESGRGVGMNDLAMNVSPSIGIAIIGSLLGSNALAGHSITGTTGVAANYSNLLLIGSVTALLGLIVFFVFKKKIYEGNHALENDKANA